MTLGNPDWIANPKAGPGRPKGSKDKFGVRLREAICEAADNAHIGGLVGYLTEQANKNPKAFLALLGKVLPTQIDAAEGISKMVIKWEKGE